MSPYIYDYPRPMLTVDAVVFRVKNGIREVLLIRRKNEPFRGHWALPGGFMDMNETLEEAVVRELEEETGLTGIRLIQMHAFSALHRDPRGRTVSVAFRGVIPDPDVSIRAGDDAARAEWFDVRDLPPLAFDHSKVIGMALEKENLT